MSTLSKLKSEAAVGSPGRGSKLGGERLDGEGGGRFARQRRGTLVGRLRVELARPVAAGAAPPVAAAVEALPLAARIAPALVSETGKKELDRFMVYHDFGERRPGAVCEP